MFHASNKQECKNPCCNATTCKLATGAQCISGACCASCKFKAYGTVCRPSVGECDINEYCSGTSALCPADLKKSNGSPCASSLAFCFNGLCPTRDNQCKFFYGTTSGDGAAGCYTTFNPRGDLHGNCGSTAVVNTYRPCTTGYVEAQSHLKHILNMFALYPVRYKLLTMEAILMQLKWFS